MNVNAKFPCSNNYSSISQQSKVREHLLMHFSDKKTWLLGDSGYPLESNLIVSFRIAPNAGTELFNNRHKMARATVQKVYW